MEEATRSTILLIEDNEASRELLKEYLEESDGHVVMEAGDAKTGFQLFLSGQIELVVLDVMLPDESGMQLCRRMKSASQSFVPILLVTGLTSTSDKVNGLEAGADDFITKPIIREEFIVRVRSHLRTKRMVDRVDQYRKELSLFNQRLQEQVEQRTRQLREALHELRRAKEEVEQTRMEIVERLGIAAEYRDEETGRHIRRMSLYVYEIAISYGLPAEVAELYRLAAPMHDIGKMGVRDHVLFKPAQLAEGETDLIKQHTVIGARILENPRTELLAVAQQMARHHHERWDGTGYPDGLKGDEIPLPARICAVADVFDAMTFVRVYRPIPMSVEEAHQEVLRLSGSAFDPAVVDAFERGFDRIMSARKRVEKWRAPR